MKTMKDSTLDDITACLTINALMRLQMSKSEEWKGESWFQEVNDAAWEKLRKLLRAPNRR